MENHCSTGNNLRARFNHSNLTRNRVIKRKVPARFAFFRMHVVCTYTRVAVDVERYFRQFKIHSTRIINGTELLNFRAERNRVARLKERELSLDNEVINFFVKIL